MHSPLFVHKPSSLNYLIKQMCLHSIPILSILNHCIAAFQNAWRQAEQKVNNRIQCKAEHIFMNRYKIVLKYEGRELFSMPPSETDKTYDYHYGTNVRMLTWL